MYKKIIVGIYLIGIYIIGSTLYNNYILYSENKKIINIQLLGLKELDILYKINISLKTYRGLKQLKNPLTNKIEEEFFKITYLLNKLNHDKFRDEINLILKKNEFYAFENIIHKIELKIIKISKTYRLFEKLSQQNYDVISSIIYTLPELIESIGIIRGKGVYHLSRKEISTLDKNLLNSTFDKFMIYQKTLVLNEQESELISMSLKQIHLHLEKLNNENFQTDSMSYFQDLTLLINHLNDYYLTSEEKLIEYLNNSLIKLNKNIKSDIFIFVFLLIIYSVLFIFLYRTINRFYVNKQKERYLSTIENELYGKLEFCHNVKEVSKECIQFLCKKIGAANGLFYIVDTKNETLSLSSTYSISPRHVNHILDLDEGVFNEVLESKEIQTIKYDEKKEVNFGSFKTNATEVVTIPIISEYNNVIAIAQLSLISLHNHYKELKKIYEIMANNLLKSQKNEENEKYFDLIDKYVITSTTNKDGIIKYASQAFQEISGYSNKELVGRSHNILRHPDVDVTIYTDMWNTIKSGKTWTKEFQNKKIDGSTYWVESTISPEIGFYGDIVGYTAIRKDITDRKIVEELSITDALTSLYNRRHFDNQLNKSLSLSQRMNTKLAFAMIDIDHFKQYNDTYGHQEGDMTLQAVANTFKKSFKRDIDMVFRLGGEEFGILFYVQELKDVKIVGEKLIKSIEKLKIEHKNSSVSSFVTISMGLFIYHNCELSSFEVYKKTDELLYKAKQNGRNQFFCNLKEI